MILLHIAWKFASITKATAENEHFSFLFSISEWIIVCGNVQWGFLTSCFFVNQYPLTFEIRDALQLKTLSVLLVCYSGVGNVWPFRCCWASIPTMSPISDSARLGCWELEFKNRWRATCCPPPFYSIRLAQWGFRSLVVLGIYSFNTVNVLDTFWKYMYFQIFQYNLHIFQY